MNSITLHHVIPKFFIPKTLDNSQSIWKKVSTFKKGHFYIIIAPSGSGKSTLANAVLGNHFEYEGSILYDNLDLKSLSIEQIVNYRKNEVQLLFQDIRLINDLTIRENIALRVFNKKNDLFETKLLAYAQHLGISHLLEKKAKNCSYGERQRAAIVRSLIHPAEFLIYDECFSHLDVENKEKAFQLINKVAIEEGSAVLFFELNDFPFSHDYNQLNL
ncbi:ATP-binding cassette domain-containing protein [Flavobacterium difficile]|uniref:ATP-binding cassette domain-containing protein n=1 Tax=Flavobacterium difficile TaxID=2709659 RepID=A0ABX0I1U4_9FLAO|nr:ATP-binding cassette domain-containing protein [Flavobacterium difficile]NHM01162.1 ATP-binding cassette domain-containing protein [Flavobacterium difficile]